MIHGIYGFIFGGSEDSNDSTSSSEEQPCSVKGKMCEDDWFLVADSHPADRFSPVLVTDPEIRDIDELSFASSCCPRLTTQISPTAEQLRKAEELKLAKARNAQRAHLEKMLFDDISTSSLTTSTFKKSGVAKMTKRSSGTSENLKCKARSKKSSGKTSSGRNNDRKVNNID